MSHERILLVEDDESLGFALVDALEREGYRPTWTRDGREALRHALDDPWDLMVLDLMLPAWTATRSAGACARPATPYRS